MADYEWKPAESSKQRLALDTPSKRSSRSRGNLNLVHHKRCHRVNRETGEQQVFQIGDAVLISLAKGNHRVVLQYLVPDKFDRTSSKKSPRKKNGKIVQDARDRIRDGLSDDHALGIIVDFYEDERDELRIKLHWLYRPQIALKLWDLGAYEDYLEEHADFHLEARELFYASDINQFDDDDDLGSPSKAVLRQYTSNHEDDIDPISIENKIELVSDVSDLNDSNWLVRRFWNHDPEEGEDWLQLYEVEGVHQQGLETGNWEIKDKHVHKRGREAGLALQLATPPATPTKSGLVVKAVSKSNKAARTKKAAAPKQAQEKAPTHRRDMDVDNASESGSASSEDEEDAFQANDNEREASTSGSEAESASSVEDEEYDATPSKKRKATSHLSRDQRPRKYIKRTVHNDKRQKAEQARRNARLAKKADKRRSAPRPALPTNGARAAIMASQTLTPFQKARAVLHVGAVPDELPCREAEFAEIENHLEDAIDEGTGSCVYIAGVPGTGKTATVRSVVQTLQRRAADGEIRPFEFLEINGMKLTEPNQAFVKLWEMVSDGEIETARHALAKLEKYFRTPSPGRKTRVVLLDELDQLVVSNKKNDIIYNFFNWPNQPQSHFVVVAVSNGLDLPDQMSHKIRSRLGGNRITFTPYQREQLATILKSRLEGLEVFEKGTVDFISMNVAKITGDARRALDVCRRAIEVVESANDKAVAAGKKGRLIKIADAQAVQKSMSLSGTGLWIDRATLHQKIMLFAISRELKKKGTEDVVFNTVIHNHFNFLRQSNLKPVPTHQQLFAVLASLSALKLVTTEASQLDHFQRIRMDIKDDLLMENLRSDSVLKGHLGHL